MNKNISIIFYTANRISDEMMNKNIEVLKKSAGDIPIISISQKPMPYLGKNIVFENKEQNYLNIYKQALLGTKLAETKYVAMCEDDTFYHSSHFELRPSSDDVFCYNMNKWSFFTWKPDIFSNRNRRTLNALIVSRDKFIEVMNERFDLLEREGGKVKMCYWSEPSRNVYERHLGVKEQKGEEKESKISILMINHEKSINYLKQGTRKKLGDKRAYYLPFWGEASLFAKRYKII